MWCMAVEEAQESGNVSEAFESFYTWSLNFDCPPSSGRSHHFDFRSVDFEYSLDLWDTLCPDPSLLTTARSFLFPSPKGEGLENVDRILEIAPDLPRDLVYCYLEHYNGSVEEVLGAYFEGCLPILQGKKNTLTEDVKQTIMMLVEDQSDDESSEDEEIRNKCIYDDELDDTWEQYKATASAPKDETEEPSEILVPSHPSHFEREGSGGQRGGSRGRGRGAPKALALPSRSPIQGQTIEARRHTERKGKARANARRNKMSRGMF
eukprot:GHVP01020598.1.p1 GENE.GHVP01020598.1~~GHVP01020598.1.p1  ORF type:complete len:264 (-),score=44.70 GHVP01020598.1:662-1453(-)